MRNTIGVSEEGKSWKGIRPPRDCRKTGCNIEELLLRESDKRPAHESTERERVAGIGQRAGKRQQILKFLPAEQTFASLRGDRQISPFKGSFITPELGPSWREKRDIRRHE